MGLDEITKGLSEDREERRATTTSTDWETMTNMQRILTTELGENGGDCRWSGSQEKKILRQME